MKGMHLLPSPQSFLLCITKTINKILLILRAYYTNSGGEHNLVCTFLLTFLIVFSRIHHMKRTCYHKLYDIIHER